MRMPYFIFSSSAWSNIKCGTVMTGLIMQSSFSVAFLALSVRTLEKEEPCCNAPRPVMFGVVVVVAQLYLIEVGVF